MREKRNEKKHQSKGAPLEMSCSKPCGGRNFLEDTSEKGFDPRFSDQCGEIDKIGFIKNYAFLQKNREAEIHSLQKHMKPGQEKRLQSLKDQYKTMNDKIKDVQERIQWQREERERVANGKRPYFLSKSEMFKKTQERKFKELKESGKLQKYQKKRNKRLMAKDKKAGIIRQTEPKE